MHPNRGLLGQHLPDFGDFGRHVSSQLANDYHHRAPVLRVLLLSGMKPCVYPLVIERVQLSSEVGSLGRHVPLTTPLTTRPTSFAADVVSSAI